MFTIGRQSPIMSEISVITRRRSLSLLAAAGVFVAAPAALAQNRTARERQKKMMRSVQRMLRDVGYDPGPIDGSRGGRTASALSSFQRDKGLERTGTLTAPTLQALSTTAARRPRPRPRIRRRR
jgi:peptidoglycan hydrolase-like protein with peptidoglycan-binding domain